MAGDKKTRKTPTKRQKQLKVTTKKINFRPWLILGMVMLVIGAYIYWINAADEPNDLLTGKIPKHTVERTGAGANVDYTKKTEQIQKAVAEALKHRDVAILHEEHVSKSVNRKQIEGTLKWSKSEILATASNDDIELLQKYLKDFLPQLDSVILAVADDKYQDKKVTRLDIGIEDQLDGDNVTIIAVQLYLLPKLNKLPINQTLLSGDNQPQIALIIDDFGYTKVPITEYRKIDCPLTFAVLPNHPYSVEAAEIGQSDGRQIIVHLPMESLSDQAKEEPMTINIDMNDQEIRAIVRELTDSVPYAIGVNNHQGSKATSNRRVMRTVLNQLTNQGMFFVDSRTSASSLAYATALDMKVPTAENQLFIDNSSDVKQIRSQLNKAAEIASQKGKIIVIGHARLNTAKVLQEMVPELQKRGFKFVFVSTLLQ